MKEICAHKLFWYTIRVEMNSGHTFWWTPSWFLSLFHVKHYCAGKVKTKQNPYFLKSKFMICIVLKKFKGYKVVWDRKLVRHHLLFTLWNVFFYKRVQDFRQTGRGKVMTILDGGNRLIVVWYWYIGKSLSILYVANIYGSSEHVLWRKSDLS